MKLILDIVKTAIRLHPKDCIFKEDAIQQISSAALDSYDGSKESLIESLANAFKDAELYCPHEGINRLPTI